MDLRTVILWFAIGSLGIWAAGILLVALAVARGARTAPRSAILVIGLGIGMASISGSALMVAYGAESIGPMIVVIVAPSTIIGAGVLVSVVRVWRRWEAG